MLLNHVLGNARLRDFKPELEEFAMDARRTLQRVLDAHPSDQARRSGSIWGRPPRGRDFQRQ
jgi:hypothetical protein